MIMDHDTEQPGNATPKKRGPERSARRKAAEAAGLSRHQMRQALAVASIPKDILDALIESDNPPSVTMLAAIGSGKYWESTPKTRRLRQCPHCGGDLTVNPEQTDADRTE